jgi:hypothetical protein
LAATLLSPEVQAQLVSARMKQQRTAAILLICSTLKAHSLHAQELRSPLRTSLSLKVKALNTWPVTHSLEPKNLSRSTTMAAMLLSLAEPELLAMARSST